jgi:hypothetical protein
MVTPVFCGNASLATIVQGEGQWLGWVYFDAYKQTYSQWILWIYAILGIIGNLAVIIWRATGFRHSNEKLLSIFFVSLATADFLWAVHLLLFQIQLGQCIETDSLFNLDFCKASAVIFTIGAPSARFTLIIIALHVGLNFLCQGRKYWRQKVTTYITSLSLIASWALAIYEAISYTIVYFEGQIYIPELQRNYADWSECSPIAWGMENSHKSGASNVLAAAFAYMCAFVLVTSVLYTSVICHAFCLRRKYGSSVTVQGLSRWAVVLMIAVAVNALSAVPIIFRSILVFTGHLSNYPADTDTAFDVTVSGIFLQFQIIANPILYSIAEIIYRMSLYKKKQQLQLMRQMGHEDWETTSSQAWGDTTDQLSNYDNQSLISADDELLTNNTNTAISCNCRF